MLREHFEANINTAHMWKILEETQIPEIDSISTSAKKMFEAALEVMLGTHDI